MACEEMKVLTRRLMDDFHQKKDLQGRRGKQRELDSADADLVESNALFTEHRLKCPVCRDVKGPLLVLDRNSARSMNLHNYESSRTPR